MVTAGAASTTPSFLAPRRSPLVALCLVLLGGCAVQSRADRSLLAEIMKIRAIDHHAHPEAVETVDPKELEPASPLGDMSAPLPARVRPDAQRWHAAWKALYGDAAVHTSVEELRGLWRAKRKMRQTHGEKWPAWVLDQAGIETVVAVLPARGPGLNGPRFRWVPVASDLIFPFPEASVAGLAQEFGIKGGHKTLDAYLRDLVVPLLAAWKAKGALAIKFGVAYRRSLDFKVQTEADAKRIYEKGASGAELTPAEYKALQDYLFFEVSKDAGIEGLAVHVHTGVGADPFFHVSGARPSLLEDALDHPTLRQTKFVLVHGGWPYDAEAGALLMKPNVYADFSAQPLLRTTRALSRTLREWLAWYPEKVLFGTDAYSDRALPLTGWEEKLWLASRTAREALALALTEMIADGEVTREHALEIARMVLRENVMRLYGGAFDGPAPGPSQPAPPPVAAPQPGAAPAPAPTKAP